MGFTRDDLKALASILRPLTTRVANIVTRSIVKIVDDTNKLQFVQGAGLQVSEDSRVVSDGTEHLQPYGLYSVPLPGAEQVVLHPNGDGAHPIAIVIADRRYRPNGGLPGTSGLHNQTTARVLLLPNGDIEIQPAAGRQVFIRSPGGTAEALVKRSEFVGHTHGPGTLAAGGDPATGATAGAGDVTGTAKLRAE